MFVYNFQCIGSSYLAIQTSFAGKAVCDEVRGILSPLPLGSRSITPMSTPSPITSVSGTATAMIDRRPKRKPKVKLAHAKYSSLQRNPPKGRKAGKFQKKLVVIEYMGPDAPRSFTLKEQIVSMRGILPEIPMDACDREIRTHIRDTIKNAEPSLSGCLLSDFEYVEASGKNLCVPAQESDFEWTGRAVKELAGSGAVYVRLTTDLCSESSDELADSPMGSCNEPDVKIVKIEKSGNHHSTDDENSN